MVGLFFLRVGRFLRPPKSSKKLWSFDESLQFLKLFEEATHSRDWCVVLGFWVHVEFLCQQVFVCIFF